MNIYFAFQPLSSAKVNAESGSRPVGPSQPLALVLNRLEYSLTFAYRVKSKLLTGPIFGGAYTSRKILASLKKDSIESRAIWILNAFREKKASQSRIT